MEPGKPSTLADAELLLHTLTWTLGVDVLAVAVQSPEELPILKADLMRILALCVDWGVEWGGGSPNPTHKESLLLMRSCSHKARVQVDFINDALAQGQLPFVMELYDCLRQIRELATGPYGLFHQIEACAFPSASPATHIPDVATPALSITPSSSSSSFSPTVSFATSSSAASADLGPQLGRSVDLSVGAVSDGVSSDGAVSEMMLFRFRGDLSLLDLRIMFFLKNMELLRNGGLQQVQFVYSALGKKFLQVAKSVGGSQMLPQWSELVWCVGSCEMAADVGINIC
jgi:hypothetical protein